MMGIFICRDRYFFFLGLWRNSLLQKTLWKLRIELIMIVSMKCDITWHLCYLVLKDLSYKRCMDSCTSNGERSCLMAILNNISEKWLLAAAVIVMTGRPTWFQNLPLGGAWSPGGATYLVPKFATRGRMVIRLRHPSSTWPTWTARPSQPARSAGGATCLINVICCEAQIIV